MAKAQKKVKIRRLGLGAIFAFQPASGPLEHWKIVGRPFKDGGRVDGKKTFSVNAVYVKTDKNDDNVQPDKVFSIDMEVVEVRSGRQDVQAIDRRDQPKGVETIQELAKRVADPDSDPDNDGTLDAFIADDEDEELANED